jgi:hypothetical protein
MRGYWKLNEDALDRTLRWTRFGRGFGPVVRQTAEWRNEWPKSWNESKFWNYSTMNNEYKRRDFEFQTKITGGHLAQIDKWSETQQMYQLKFRRRTAVPWTAPSTAPSSCYIVPAANRPTVPTSHTVQTTASLATNVTVSWRRREQKADDRKPPAFLGQSTICNMITQRCFQTIMLEMKTVIDEHIWGFHSGTAADKDLLWCGTVAGPGVPNVSKDRSATVFRAK